MDTTTKGTVFEDEIASLFSMQGYEVKRQVRNSVAEEYDLLCTKREFGSENVILVECKIHAKPIPSRIISDFYSRAKRMLTECKITNAFLISKSGFVKNFLSNELTKELPRNAIRFFGYTEFISEIVGFDYYLDCIIADFENQGNSDHSEKKIQPLIEQFSRDNLYTRYIDLSAIEKSDNSNGNPVQITAYLEDQLSIQNQNCLLLGEIGSGKTSVCLYLTYLMSKQFRNQNKSGSKRIPLYISLSGAGKYADLYKFLVMRLKEYGFRFDNSSELRRLIEVLPIALLLDGFDEMMQSNTPYVIKDMAKFLSPLFKLSIPVLLTSSVCLQTIRTS
ncbi:MAG: hypothetical protein GY834_12245 [Bacteroidetes bacterium]|nr:hypothetical protein [Bacteroidota bacterium]